MYIDQLPNLPSADGTEKIPVSKNGVDCAATVDQLTGVRRELSTTIYAFCRNTSIQAGTYIRFVQNSSDNPCGNGIVAVAIIAKRTDNGDYSVVLVFGNGKAYSSAQLAPGAASITWYQL